MQSAPSGQARQAHPADDREHAPCRSSWAQPSASEIQAVLVLNILYPKCSRRRGAPSLTTRSQSASRCDVRRPLVVERSDMQNQAKDVRQNVAALRPSTTTAPVIPTSRARRNLYHLLQSLIQSKRFLDSLRSLGMTISGSAVVVLTDTY